MHLTAVGDIVLHYELAGREDGPPLIFIHSVGTELRIWDAVVPHFVDRYRVIRYDLRGHGLSDSPQTPCSIQDHAADLAGLLAALRIESAILVGLSVGGQIAMSYAAAYSKHVTALVLCDTGAIIGSFSSWNERIQAVQQSGFDPVADVIVSRWFTPEFAANRPAEYRAYRNMLIRTPVSGYTATCEALRDADLTDAARHLQIKTLVVCGSEDKATPPAVSHALTELLPDARFALIAGAAHLPCVEQSEALASVIKAFLKESGYDR